MEKNCNNCLKKETCKIINSCKEIGNEYCRFYEQNNNSTMETPAKKKRGPQPGSKRNQKPVILEEKITKVNQRLGGERGKSVQNIPHTPTNVGSGSINSIPPSVS